MLTRPRRPAGADLAAAGFSAVGAICWILGSGPLTGSGLNGLLAALSLLTGCTLTALAAPTDRAAGMYGGLIVRTVRPREAVWAVRALVILTAPLAGAGVLAYAAASLADTVRSTAPAAVLDWRRAAGTGMLGLAFVLALAAVGVQVASPVYLWPALLIGSGLAQFWNSAGTRSQPDELELFAQGSLRSLLGVLLTIGGMVLFLNHILHLHDTTHIVVATSVAVGVIAFIAGPWWFRNRRLLEQERLNRALAVERAEIADQLHDSVLQTLALIQRRSDEPDTVAMLARRQERDLRDWLLGRRTGPHASTLQEALRTLIADIEDRSGVNIETVTVGDRRLDAGGQAMLAATREALINATRHAPGAPVSVFMRTDSDLAQIFVRDRGPGFDPTRIAADRHGINDSIIARMQRNGGRADLHSTPGGGCEIILTLPHR